MLFACKCLNVTLVTPLAASEPMLASATVTPATGGRALIESLRLQQAKLTGEQLQFLQKAVGPLQSVRVTVNHPELVETSHVECAADSGAAAAAAPGAPLSPSSLWELNQCVGCDVWTHAIDHSAQLVLANPETLTNAKDVIYLSSTAHYSPTFRVLINQSQRDKLLAPQRNSSDMAAARQLKAASPRNAELLQFDQQQQRPKRLTQQFHDAVQQEIEATDERIRAYTERQFAELQRFRERALADCQQLCKLAATVRPTPAVGVNAAAAASAASAIVSAKQLLETTPPATPDASTPMSIGNSPNFGRLPLSASSAASTASASTSVLVSSLSAHRALPFKPKTSPLRFASTQPPVVTVSPSYGGVIEEAVDAFYYEMDDMPATADASLLSNASMLQHSNSYMSDVEESDSDDSSELQSRDGRAIPRSQTRPKSLSIAQSMPITMPASSNQPRSSVHDDDDYDEYAGNLDDGVDIAASIKALARSVHGDAVFGDLPRPRFSTQI